MTKVTWTNFVHGGSEMTVGSNLVAAPAGIEPATYCLEGCFKQFKANLENAMIEAFYQGNQNLGPPFRPLVTSS